MDKYWSHFIFLESRRIVPVVAYDEHALKSLERIDDDYIKDKFGELGDDFNIVFRIIMAFHDVYKLDVKYQNYIMKGIGSGEHSIMSANFCGNVIRKIGIGEEYVYLADNIIRHHHLRLKDINYDTTILIDCGAINIIRMIFKKLDLNINVWRGIFNKNNNCSDDKFKSYIPMVREYFDDINKLSRQENSVSMR